MPIINLSEIHSKEVVPGFKGKFVHSENVTIVHWDITAGSVLSEHNHPHEQITNIIKGELELSIEGLNTRVLKSGDIAVIPSNLRHSGKAMTDCYIIDVFYPIREDYKSE